MEIDIGLIKDIITIIALIIGAYIAIFVYFNFAPVVRLKIEHEWINRDYLKILLEVENLLKTRMKKDFILFQILEHKKENTEYLSEWVPFKEDAIIEKPIIWKEPENVFSSTRYLYPNDRIKVESLYHVTENNIIHTGLQLKAKLNFLGRILSRMGKQPLRWTTTRIIIKKSP